MSEFLDPSLAGLNDCGCCEGVGASTPGSLSNRPGLSAIAYRAGTHQDFFASLKAAISGSRLPALQALATRDTGDFSIALLDAFAVVADVLTFYQERIANEAYLRTAAERRSVLELARLIDYQLRPGVAAGAWLAFTIEDAAGAFGQSLTLGTGVPGVAQKAPPVTIEAGVKVQSVPGPGETPQFFETVEKVEARAAWNAMRPRLSRRQAISTAMTELLFEGISTNLKPGDGLVLVPDGEGPFFCEVTEVAPETITQFAGAPLQRTRVAITSLPQTSAPVFIFEPGFGFGVFGGSAPALFHTFGSSFLGNTVSQLEFSAAAILQPSQIFDYLKAAGPAPPGIFALRARTAIFGHNAPPYDALPSALRAEAFYANRANDWVDNSALSDYPGEPANSKRIYLDASYPNIVAGSQSFVVLRDGSALRIYTVAQAAAISKADFTLSAKVTRLTLDTNDGLNQFSIRGTTVLAQSEKLTLAPLPITAPVEGVTLELDGFIDGLAEGQELILCGERDDLRGVSVCELALIDSVQQVLEPGGYTIVTLKKDLIYSYVRETVTISGNVALATHGESVAEVLGGGDGSQVFQRFVLKQPPLTYVSSASPTGADTTLEVRVNNLLWSEVPSLFEAGPADKAYIARLGDDGKTTVTFGDGRTGARPPTGEANITARYRKGIGVGGQVGATALTQLLSRPLGVKGVTNPLAASGAQDPEALADARVNAPLAILTLGRVVSLQDYEDFARAFSGIGKAKATATWNGERRGVFITVSGVDGAPLPDDGPTMANLVDSLRANGDATVPLAVRSSSPSLFRVGANVKIDGAYLPGDVLAAVQAKLQKAFSFGSRDFGQPVTSSEILAAIHQVAGVVAVELRELYRIGLDPAGTLRQRLPAAAPVPGAGLAEPAELLLLDKQPLSLGVLL